MTPPCPRCADLTWHDGELQRQAARAVEAERQRDEALRDRDHWRESMSVRWSLVREVEEMLGVADAPPSDEQLRRGVDALRALRRDRDTARAKLADTEQSLRERVAEREALCERVSVLEEDRDEAHECAAAMAKPCAECEDTRRERDEARESLRLSVAAWDAAGMQGRDAASVIREAEERGARWALREIAMWAAGAWSLRAAEAGAARICAEARKAGEHG